MAIVVIDAGHGGTDDAGRSTWGGAGGVEKHVTLELARRVAVHLGGLAQLTRERDVNLSLGERAELARRAGAQVFVSIHAGEGAGRDRVFVHHRAGSSSHRLAGALAGDVQAAEMAVLTPGRHGPQTAACLLEMDSLSRDPGRLDAQGRAIACGIRRYLSAESNALAAEAPGQPGSERLGKVARLHEGRALPWLGKIANTWTAALRNKPQKNSADPHLGTIADLPRGTSVRVVDRKDNWMKVEVTFQGQDLTGFVSGELIDFERLDAFQLAPIDVKVHVPSITEAFVILKRAFTRLADGGVLSADEQDDAELAASVLRHTKKYTVDAKSFDVQFEPPAPGKKIRIDTIEDFVLFVEEVERTYPKVDANAVASEIRELWWAKGLWLLLSAASGVPGVDIESLPNPVAGKFDMADLAPSGDGAEKILPTRMGEVNIGHVVAGLDVVLNGISKSRPDGGNDEIAYDLLVDASGGDVRDFGTWAGDLGQAYGELLLNNHVLGKPSTFADTIKAKAPDTELLGDIHGYIAIAIWRASPPSASPTGGKFAISNVLRDFYLVDKSAQGDTYSGVLARILGVPESDVRDHVLERSLKFARLWYAKGAIKHRGWWDSDGWTRAGIIQNTTEEFDERHLLHQAGSPATERLDHVVDHFMSLLPAKVL